jgi:hypothetical protein
MKKPQLTFDIGPGAVDPSVQRAVADQYAHEDIVAANQQRHDGIMQADRLRHKDAMQAAKAANAADRRTRKVHRRGIMWGGISLAAVTGLATAGAVFQSAFAEQTAQVTQEQGTAQGAFHEEQDTARKELARGRIEDVGNQVLKNVCLEVILMTDAEGNPMLDSNDRPIVQVLGDPGIPNLDKLLSDNYYDLVGAAGDDITTVGNVTLDHVGYDVVTSTGNVVSECEIPRDPNASDESDKIVLNRFLETTLNDLNYFTYTDGRLQPTDNFRSATAEERLLFDHEPIQLVGEPTIANGELTATFLVGNTPYSITIPFETYNSIY